MKVSVIIPTLGESRELERVLGSLAAQDFPSADFELIVVGNRTSSYLDRLAGRWSERCPGFQLAYTGSLGVNRARNLGIARARGEILVFLDDDCVPANARYLHDVVILHARHPQAVAIGGFYEPAPRCGFWARAYVEISREWLACANLGPEAALDLVGGNVSYKRGLLGECWRFDPTIVFGGAETEFHARLLQAGHTFVLSEAIPVRHRPSFGFTGFLRRAFRQGHRRELLEAQGVAPKYQTYRTQHPGRRSWAASLFTAVFRLGAEWSRIELYEERLAFRLWELVRRRTASARAWLRAIVWVREFCYAHAFVSREARSRDGE